MMQMLGLRGGTPVKAKVEETTTSSVTNASPSNVQHTTTTTMMQAITPSPVTGQKARALRLVYCDERGQFRMDAEAVAALQLVKGPLGVVSVCGRARQGKSFILNQLLGRSSGFQVAPTHRPCTKGLWMWSTPIKRTAPDGSEYSLLLLDSEGIDAYDQTGTYSTQIFSLAVLLSSMFIYNQMGGIDEAALDRLSLVTEMTKHIRVRASQGQTSAAELGQFSPLFLWLLRDFYLDLTELGRRITPRDYLESALQPVGGSGKAIAAKNEIRESIRALFPDRDCFTLVRPLNDERDLQRLDQIPMDRMRSEFRSGLDTLTKYVFERTRPKQLGSTIMNGPMLAGLTQSFLDALNAGAVPTIATSWQNVEENECRRAHDMAVENYLRMYDKTTPPEENALQDAHEAAVQAALATYNHEAVGTGAPRLKYERQLMVTLKKQFEDHRKKVSMEAELQILRQVGSMEERFRLACHAPGATFDQALTVLDTLLAEYEQSAFGATKWQKLVKLLMKSLNGPLHDLVKRASDKAATEYATLELKFRSSAERITFIEKQTESAQRDAQEWKKRYESSLDTYKASSEKAAAQYAALQSKYSSLEERRASLSSQLEEARKEVADWRSKYDHLLTDRKSEDERLSSEHASLQSRCTSAEARLAAAREQSESAKEEAAEWRRKHDSVVADSRAAVERSNALRERANKQHQLREDALRAEFASSIAEKDSEVKDLQTKLEHAERRVAAMTTRMKDHESKANSQTDEMAALKAEVRHLQSLVDNTKSSTITMEKDLESARQERAFHEERLRSVGKRLEEAEEKSRIAEREAKRAVEVAEKAKEEATMAERDKLETQTLAVERLAALERAERRAEGLEREKIELAQELDQVKYAELEASSRASALERRLDEREREMEQLLKASHEQRANTVEVLESLVASERAARSEANTRAESLSLQLQTVQARLDSLQQELTTVRNHETALDMRLRTYQTEPAGTARSKRPRPETDDTGTGGESSAQDMDVEITTMKRAKREHHTENGSSLMLTSTAEGDSSVKPEDEYNSKPVEYTKLTISKLKQILTKSGFGAELLAVRNPTKKDLISLYETLILRKES
ncbi:guanylate-binding protein 1/3/4/7 [Marchantia polymorpha subsp. ruderalis]|uniref:GB1/RHD3-type G domain-containing protein n=2 Tax=Marchantia polymorpha TaxID=3197 RepID=A0AAF6BDQ5_MARPO|nr:hypothetical protein MARPO_0197s0017 [Marchantia polymorpha]BBN10139.1 hypothetical protein Mp_5g01230 [Marchantia polymorpha subsp. ruderalis]|eukprot:PTQ27481.1 hypothetical protein MARPO_0197s0017 [Marchantia polymorpha]